jgi:hypothetical protein
MAPGLRRANTASVYRTVAHQPQPRIEVVQYCGVAHVYESDRCVAYYYPTARGWTVFAASDSDAVDCLIAMSARR